MHLALERGDWATAEARWRQSVALMPAQSDLSIELVVALDAAGRRAEADRLLDEAMAPLLAALKRYGGAANLNNQAAWTLARCGRRLDSALRHAQMALRSDSSNPAMIDTLAEVQMRRDEPAAALTLMGRGRRVGRRRGRGRRRTRPAPPGPGPRAGRRLPAPPQRVPRPCRQGGGVNAPDAPQAAWRLGTMGFGYPDWTGPFYAGGTKSQDRLSAYARAFDAVELDTTFHAIPPAAVVRHWRQETPDGFRFTAKLPKQITHEATAGTPLSSAASRDLTRQFLAVTDELGDKRRAVLMQFPPDFDAGHFEDLSAYLAEWPASVAAAVELRHDSWWRPGAGPAVARLLREKNMAWVVGDEPPKEVAGLPPDAAEATAVYKPRPLVLTADWLYVRWIGRHQQFPDRAAERLDPTPRLAWWAGKLSALLAEGRAKAAMGFFNNGYAGHSPAAVRKMLALLDLPARDPPAAAASLFPV